MSNVFQGIDPAAISVDRNGAVVHRNEAVSAAVASVDATPAPLADNGGTCVNSGVCDGANLNCTNSGDCSKASNLGTCTNTTTTPPT